MSADATSPSRDGTTVYLVVTARTVGRLGAVLELMAADGFLARCPLTVVCSPDTEEEVRASLAASPVRVLTAPGPGRRGAVEAVVTDLPSCATPTFAALTLPKAAQVHATSAELHGSHTWVRLLAGTAGADGRAPDGAPVLLTSSRTLPGLARAIAQARGGADAGLPGVDAAIAHVTKARLETVDPGDGSVVVSAVLGGSLPPGIPEPGWQFELALLDGATVVAVSGAVGLRPRTDRFGSVGWNQITAEIPLGNVSDGDYTLGIRPAGGVDVHAIPIGTRQGPLLSARPVLLPATDAGGGALRYLVHNAARGPGAALLIRRGDDDAARRRWTRALRGLDATFVLRHRRATRMRMLRLARALTRPLFRRRDVWLVGERPGTAQDNGMHLFRHLRTTAPDREVYYVVEADSPQADRVRDLGNVVDHSSPRHCLLMLHARVLANAYSIHHMLPRQWDPGEYARYLAWRVGALRVYLKHGVHLSPNAMKRGSAGYDVVVTATHHETEVMRQVTGYDAQLALTGLARYDALVPTPPSRTVLLMLTWRRYLVPRLFSGEGSADDDYAGSTYDVFLRSFLSSERLAEILRRHDYRLEFLPHYNLSGQAAGLATADGRIVVADPDAMSIQDQLRRCDLLVTDYSSVHFDVAYMGTPVVYSRFDEEEYETRHASASWFDYDTEGFGPVARTLDETLDAIDAVLAAGCVVDPVHAARVESAFAQRDTGNCARIVKVIEERLADGGAGAR